MELATREYTLFPLCYVIAIAGMVMISTFSMLACQNQKNVKPLLYLGKNSLYMLCIHKVDYLWMNCFNFSNQYIRAILTLMIDLGVFSILMFFIEKWKVKNKQSEN